MVGAHPPQPQNSRSDTTSRHRQTERKSVNAKYALECSNNIHLIVSLFLAMD